MPDGLFVGYFKYLGRHFQILSVAACEDASVDSAVRAVTAVRNFYVAPALRLPVRGVNWQPCAVHEEFGPGVRSSLTIQESAYIPRRYAARAQHSYQDMSVILTYTEACRKCLGGRCPDRSGAGRIGHVLMDCLSYPSY